MTRAAMVWVLVRSWRGRTGTSTRRMIDLTLLSTGVWQVCHPPMFVV
jgi:hypothetical protein